MNDYNDITIIIPTHNRHDYLKRVLNLYQAFTIKIIIVDSTPTKFIDECLQNENVVYKHTPNRNWGLKWYEALHLVKTNYVLYCADDDFIFPKAINESVNFLNANKDYVCIQGRILFYKYLYNKKNLEYNLTDGTQDTNFLQKKFCVDADNISDRVLQCMEPYRHVSYSIHRLENIYEIYQLLLDFNQLNLIEVALVIMTAINGKTKELDHIFHLREYINKSRMGPAEISIAELIKSNHIEYQKVHTIISNYIQKNDKNMSAREASALVTKSFDAYGSFISEMDKYKQLRNNIKVQTNCLSKKLDEKILQELYKFEPSLKRTEKIIIHHNIDSGYEFPENEKKIKTSSDLNKLYQSIQKSFLKFKNSNQRVAIYGAGVIAKIIGGLFHEQIAFFVDKNKNLYNKQINDKKVYNPDYLIEYKHMYDVILISVLAREEEILHFLKQELNIEKDILSLDF